MSLPPVWAGLRALRDQWQLQGFLGKVRATSLHPGRWTLVLCAWSHRPGPATMQVTQEALAGLTFQHPTR